MKTSKIYLLTLPSFEELVEKSNSLSEILKKLNLNISSGNYKILKRRLKEDNINYNHIKLGSNSNRGRTFPLRAQPIEELLIENSPCKNTNNLKKRLLKEGLLKNECYKCGLKNEWQGELIVLQIDHINGDSRDNRLENLRILCPNCHSQTSTYAAKNKVNKVKKVKIKKLRTTKIVWPEIEKLTQMVEETNFSQVGKLLGVSDNAVRKHIKKLRF